MRSRALRTGPLLLLLLALPLVLSAPRADARGGGAFGGRGGRRNLRAEGGAGTQGAVDLGLAWLARNARPEGGWAGNAALGDEGMTGLALLPFLGAGETHKTGSHRDTVRAALKVLRAGQAQDGCLVPAGSPETVRDHAIATLALTEAYALTGSPLLKPSAQRAIDWLQRAQAKGGGWGRTSGADVAEVEPTAWAVMAWKSARESGGLNVGPHMALGFLRRVSAPATGLVAPRVGAAPDLVATAMAGRAKILLGHPGPEVRALLKHLPRREPAGPAVDSLVWTFGSQALFQVGGSAWKAWNQAKKTALLPHQQRDGDLAGSWDPVGPWAEQAGRTATTALHVLCLEVYYRYTRLFGIGGGGARGAIVIGAGAAPSTGGTREPNENPYGDVFYRHYGVNPFVDTEDDALSTFAVDVDTASYAIARRVLRDGNLPDPASVRVEEFVNAFPSDTPPPESGTFRLVAEGMRSPFGGPRHHQLRLALRARDVEDSQRKPARLTFVVDVSGSMARENRLGLVKRTLRLLVSRLRADDRVALVIYGSAGRVLLRHTANLDAIVAAIDRLEPGGSTNAEEGLRLGYGEAAEAFAAGAVNRVILCSDGVANVGRTGPETILEVIAGHAKKGIELTTVGFGMGNYNDVLLEQLADKGNGRYAYVDTFHEARRLFLTELTGTLQTVARDTKVQVNFDPEVVSRWRLLGYENRDVADEDFRKDDVDAGEVGAGQSVTALYELKLVKGTEGERLGTFRVRYRLPDEDRVVEESIPLPRALLAAPPSRRLRRDAAVAELAEILRGSYWARDGSLAAVKDLLAPLLAEVEHAPEIVELMELVNVAKALRKPAEAPPPEERPELPESGER